MSSGQYVLNFCFATVTWHSQVNNIPANRLFFISLKFLSGTIFEQDELLEFAKLGSFLQYDLFGIETSHYEVCDYIDMPSDAARVGYLKLFKENNYLDRLLIAQDIHTKHRLVRKTQIFFEEL